MAPFAGTEFADIVQEPAFVGDNVVAKNCTDYSFAEETRIELDFAAAKFAAENNSGSDIELDFDAAEVSETA